MEGKREGKVEGKHEVLGDIKNQIQGVYNRSFRDGWKAALEKVDTPATSDLLLRENTSLPYPDAGLKESDKEDVDEEDDEDKEDEVLDLGDDRDGHVANPVLIPADDPSISFGMALVVSVPVPAGDPSVSSGMAPVASVPVPAGDPSAPTDLAPAAEP